MDKFYKYILVTTGVVFLAVVAVLLLKVKSLENENRQMASRLVSLQQNVKESETAMSSLSNKNKDLEDLLKKGEGNNKELLDIIKEKDEQIWSLEQVALRWKDKYFEIKNATETIISNDGNQVSDSCKDELKNTRFRVDFSQDKDFVGIAGHTLTNPAEAFVNVKFLRNIVLTLVLTKTRNNQFRAYVDTNNSDVVPVNLSFNLDESIFEKKWYEKFTVGSAVGIGNGFNAMFDVKYEILNNLALGPAYMYTFDGDKTLNFYGVSASWAPFLR